MTKILYVLGTQSRNNNQELRWSLRSLEQNAADDVEPVIVGAVPDWFKGEAMPFDDKTRRKEKNILSKIAAAISWKLVEGTFQISADDHFWLKETVFAELPIYYRQQELPQYVGEGNNYAKALGGTRAVLQAMNLPIYNTTCHANAWACAEDLPRITEMLTAIEREPGRFCLAHEYGFCSWAVFPNLIISRGRIPQFRHDIKLGNASAEEVESAFAADVISISDDAFLSQPFLAKIQNTFPKKSRWEK